MNFGYDNNWWAGVIGQQSFINDYGRYNGPDQDRSLPSTWLSAASGTPIAGWIIGCLLAGYLTSTFGRKMTIIIICVVALIGMVIQAAVLNYWVLMVGRLINAFSMGIEANCVPMFMAELAPASIRGGLVNFYQSWLYIGAALAAITVYASSITLTGIWSYRTDRSPMAAIWFIPESPRWLLGKGRKEEAMKALSYMRAGGSTEEEVATELNLIDLAMQEERENNLATSYADCFKGTNLRRTIIAIGVQILQQAQGNSFTTTYLVIFLKQVGVKEPLLINVAKMCCNFGATLLTFFLTDMLGRRPMLMGGSFFMAGLMWTGAFAAACWGSVMWTVTTEVATTQLRERTISIATMLGFVTSLLITYINPFVQNEPGYLGAKVETSGRSLEELDELFRAKVPAWKSKDYLCTGIGTQITHIQNIEGKRVSIDRARSISGEPQEDNVKK
uniref:Major facilitator superfamily (MFS) profile domain-containing protein n=1 Tax=Bionectria ochroleuca TaxID=29856 RepID=A0A0B7KFS9_BIOOC